MKIQNRIAIVFTVLICVCVFAVPVYASEDIPTGQTATSDTDGVTIQPTPTSTPSTITVEEENVYPHSVTGEKFPGSGTAVDYMSYGGKEFYTIKTKDEKTYYLVIDNEKSQDNVYFLSEINESSLSSTGIIQNQAPPVEAPQQETKAESNNNGFIIGFLLFLGAVGGVGYYFKIVKPKQAKVLPEDEDEDDEAFKYEDIEFSEEQEEEQHQ